MSMTEFFTEVFRYMTAIAGLIGVMAVVLAGARWAGTSDGGYAFWVSLAVVYGAAGSATLLGIYDRLGAKP